jgi:hypothetical protein
MQSLDVLDYADLQPALVRLRRVGIPSAAKGLQATCPRSSQAWPALLPRSGIVLIRFVVGK